jgi:beta-glucosidase
MTWPIAAADHPSTKDYPGQLDFYTYHEMQGWGREIPGYSYTNHDEDIYVGYRYFDTFGREVAYPFGFGLSYTTFEFNSLKVKKSRNDAVEVSITVKNTGSVGGKEVAQVYVQAPKGRLEKPAHELKAFAKTRELQPGESQVLTMTIPVRMLASFDEAGSQWLAEAGTYTFCVGSSSRDIKATAPLKIAEYTEKTSNALAPQAKLNLLKQ